ncbi:MAG TPA: NHL repeat-containing protein, partial [Solirubrobacteraceae bacterium]|nr:NHL repeat-containing protein [Solirubrobacteraceae bacterium]
MLSVLGFLVFAGVPASAAVTHTYLSQLTGFGEPTAVAVDAAGDVYVVDSSAGTVDRFSSAGAPLAFSASESYVEGSKLTGTPGGSFGEPRGVAVNDENGDLYVADRTAGVVDVFSSTGVYLSQLTGPPATAPVPGPFQCPWGLAVDQSTHDLYVTNTCEGAVVDVFSSTGVYVSQFGAGVVNGFSRGVAVNDLTGDAYIETTSEGGGSSSEVDVFGSMGSFLTPAWNGAGTPEGPFGFDTLHVGLDPTTHHVYVIDARSGVVDEFAASASEEYLGQLTGTPAGPFSGPQAVAVNPANGDLYVADGGEGSGVVDVFGPAIEVPGTSVQAATGLTTTTAVVSGSVNPAGIQVTACEFEYGTSTSYGQSAPCEPAPAQIGAGNSPKAVTANL